MFYAIQALPFKSIFKDSNNPFNNCKQFRVLLFLVNVEELILIKLTNKRKYYQTIFFCSKV